MPCTPDCGSCCDPVTMRADEMLAILNPNLDVEARPQAVILREMWAPLGPLEVGGVAFPDYVAVACIHYDVAGRSCGIYETRPPVCRDYPFYSREPNLEDMDGPRDRVCGYQADVGRRVLPLVQITERAL
jgi:Fe-S-cluster containining protein